MNDRDQHNSYVACEVLTAVIMKSFIFWDVTYVVHWKWTKVSEEHAVPFFRLKEEAKQETSVKAGGKQSKSACQNFRL
jgi:hypothetical protein